MIAWKDIAAPIAKWAPMVGSLLAGPEGPLLSSVGAMVASALGVGNTPDEISTALVTNPDAAVKLKQIEATNQVAIRGLLVQSEANRLANDTATIAAVNVTMQAEVKGEHWASWLWRPFLGFMLGVMIFGCYFILPILHLPVPQVPESVWLLLASILGVASYFRGKAQADPDNSAPVKG